MKMRKNLMVGLLAALLAFAGVACGDDEGGTTDGGSTGASEPAPAETSS